MKIFEKLTSNIHFVVLFSQATVIFRIVPFLIFTFKKLQKENNSKLICNYFLRMKAAKISE